MFPAIAFLNYEMIEPSDRFGQQMIENIEMRGIQLLGIQACPTTKAQADRLSKILGNGMIESLSMLQVYNERLRGQEKQRIESLEMFDEFEEWNMLQSHYCLILGARSSSSADLSHLKI